MFCSDKLKQHYQESAVATLIEASLAHQTGEEVEANLQIIQKLIPSLKDLGVWSGGDSLYSAETLAMMVAGLEGSRAR